MFWVARMLGVARMLRMLGFIRVARLCHCENSVRRMEANMPRSSEPTLVRKLSAPSQL